MAIFKRKSSGKSSQGKMILSTFNAFFSLDTLAYKELDFDLKVMFFTQNCWIFWKFCLKSFQNSINLQFLHLSCSLRAWFMNEFEPVFCQKNEDYLHPRCEKNQFWNQKFPMDEWLFVRQVQLPSPLFSANFWRFLA